MGTPLTNLRGRYGIGMGTISRELVVRRPRQGEGARMAELYREAFGRRVPGRRLHPRFTFEDSIVAAVGDDLVGIGCHSPAEDDLDPLLGCLAPDVRRIVEPLGTAPYLGVEPPLVVAAPAGVAPVRGARDRVVSAIAVDRRYRRLGVGRAIAVEQLRLALRERVPQVFVHCVEGSGSRELYERLGFVPLVHLARHYRDGAGMTLLYRRLQ